MTLINEWYFRFRNILSKKLPKTYHFCNNRKSIIKFFIAGSLAGIGNLVLLFVFHGVFEWDVILSTSLAFILAFLISFSLQKFWTFRDKSSKRIGKQLALYFATAFISLNINGILMHLLVNRYNVWYLLAQFVINLFIGLLNFVIYKFIIFTKNETCCEKKTIEG